MQYTISIVVFVCDGTINQLGKLAFHLDDKKKDVEYNCKTRKKD